MVSRFCIKEVRVNEEFIVELFILEFGVLKFGLYDLDFCGGWGFVILRVLLYELECGRCI